MVLTPEQIEEIVTDWFSEERAVARASKLIEQVEVGVRKQDELIRQMLDALENSSPHTDRSFAWKDGKWQNQRTAAITAARAWLEGKPCA